MGNIRFRDYQWEGVLSIWNYFEQNKTGNPIVAMPTGTGKSLVIAGFLRTVFEKYPRSRIMALTHVKELIEQNHKATLSIWPTAPVGIYSSGLNKREAYANITFAGIASVVKRAEQFGHIDLVIIDEAHLVSPTQTTMYRKFIDALTVQNPQLKVIGFTATPYRMGQGMIIDSEDGLFDAICYDLTTMAEFNNLIEEGYLSPLIPKRTNTQLDISGVHRRGGEFIAKELQAAVDKKFITEAAVKEAIELGKDRNCWLVFTTGIEHTIHTTEILNAYGVSARAVHSGNKDYPASVADRDHAIADFKAGTVQAIVNNNVLTTGFDHPQIDMILNLRPSESTGLWVQMLGRGTRPVYADGYDLSTKEGRLAAIEEGGKKNCLVLDYGANTKKLGPINDPILPKAKGGKGGGDAPVKLCENTTNDGTICNTYVHASVRWCPYCGGEFHFQTHLQDSAGTDELIKMNLPEVEHFKVDHISYVAHHKRGGVTSLKVVYYCGYRMFTEWVCIEHTTRIRKKAERWWRERSKVPCPNTVNEALEIAETLTPATDIRVWTNTKYPEILAYDFLGTCFGETNPDECTAPTQEALTKQKIEHAAHLRKTDKEKAQEEAWKQPEPWHHDPVPDYFEDIPFTDAELAKLEAMNGTPQAGEVDWEDDIPF